MVHEDGAGGHAGAEVHVTSVVEARRDDDEVRRRQVQGAERPEDAHANPAGASVFHSTVAMFTHARSIGRGKSVAPRFNTFLVCHTYYRNSSTTKYLKERLRPNPN